MRGCMYPALARLEPAEVPFLGERIGADRECLLERGLRHERRLQIVGGEHREIEHREIEQREGALQRPIVRRRAETAARVRTEPTSDALEIGGRQELVAIDPGREDFVAVAVAQHGVGMSQQPDELVDERDGGLAGR